MCLESEVLREDWQDKDPHDFISVIMIKFADGTDPQAFVKQVEESGIDAKCLLTGDTIASLQGQLDVTMQVMFALWAASLLIAVLSLTGRFNALARERKKEIGLLRALGLKKKPDLLPDHRRDLRHGLHRRHIGKRRGPPRHGTGHRAIGRCL